MSVLMLDVDYFKLYNDQYGHQQGDDCLRRIAGVLKTRIHRATDLAARYGGEEFCVILSFCSEEDAVKIAEQMRSQVEKLQIEHRLADAGVVTISVGVATMVPLPGTAADELVRQADIALYNAKRLGRNTVVCAGKQLE